MGSKFCDLNVFGGDRDTVKRLCAGYTVKAQAQSWVTVMSRDLEWGMAQKEARRLSKAILQPVLSTEYFDDDYVEFGVYLGGKRVARHVPAEYEGFPRVLGKSGAWAAQFGLSQSDEKALQVIFKETSPEASLRLLECVLGCPLWPDPEAPDGSFLPDQSYLTEYLERKKAERKIRNQTKLTLLDEVSGNFGFHVFYPAIQTEPGDQLSVWEIHEGTLRKVFQKEISGTPTDFRVCAHGGDTFLITLHDHTFVKFREGDPAPRQEQVYVFSRDGEIMDKLQTSCLYGSFLDQDRVFLDGMCWNLQTHRQEWRIGAADTAYGIEPPVRLRDGRCVIVYDIRVGKQLESYLMTFLPDGSGQIRLRLDDYRHWSHPLVSGNAVYLGCGDRVVCYNGALEEQWDIPLNTRIGQLGKAFLDEVTRTLYLSTYEQVMALDLKERQIAAVRRIPDSEDCYLHGVLPGMGPIMLTGDSSFQVWDQTLRPISRHRTKGGINQVVHQNGRVYLLTNSLAENTMQKTEHGWKLLPLKPGCLRLYELKPSSQKRAVIEK